MVNVAARVVELPPRTTTPFVPAESLSTFGAVAVAGPALEAEQQPEPGACDRAGRSAEAGASISAVPLATTRSITLEESWEERERRERREQREALRVAAQEAAAALQKRREQRAAAAETSSSDWGAQGRGVSARTPPPRPRQSQSGTASAPQPASLRGTSPPAPHASEPSGPCGFSGGPNTPSVNCFGTPSYGGYRSPGGSGASAVSRLPLAPYNPPAQALWPEAEARPGFGLTDEAPRVPYLHTARSQAAARCCCQRRTAARACAGTRPNPGKYHKNGFADATFGV